MIRFAELVLVISALIAINVSIAAANSGARVRCTDNAGGFVVTQENRLEARSAPSRNHHRSPCWFRFGR